MQVILSAYATCVSYIIHCTEPTIDALTTIEVLNGDTATLECQPSISCFGIQRIWTYMTKFDSGSFRSLEDINRSRFQSQSDSLHQLVIPVATVSDTGSYTCLIKNSFSNVIIFNQTISLIVVPGNI